MWHSCTSRHRHWPSLERLEDRRCLRSVGFAEEIPILCCNENPRPSRLVDLDNDGDIDVISQGRRGIHWFENADGQGTFAKARRLVRGEVRAFDLADINSDGHLDLITAAATISWHANRGDATFGAAIEIDVAVRGVTWLAATDLDGDDDPDIAIRYTDPLTFVRQLAFLENLQTPTQFQLHTIIAGDHDRVTIADLDEDGDIDFVISKPVEGLLWVENLPGKSSFATHLVARIDALAFAADRDADGDDDLLVFDHETAEVTWFENSGRGSFVRDPMGIDNAPRLTMSHTNLADLNGDGRADLIAIHDPDTLIYRINTGAGFGDAHVIEDGLSGARIISTADLDGDRDIDLILKTTDGGHSRLLWYEYVDGTFQIRLPLSSTGSDLSSFTTIDFADGDLDLDGDNDVVVLSSAINGKQVGWHENIDGRGTYSRFRLIKRLGSLSSLALLDADEDGDVDIYLKAPNGVLWVENLGQGRFNDVEQIFSGRDPGGIWPLHLDGDEQIDLAFADFSGISWRRGTGNGTYSQSHVLLERRNFTSLFGDVDDDGDIDVLFADVDSTRIRWFENVGGDSLFDSAKTLVQLSARSEVDLLLDLTDLDEDGDTDLIIGGGRSHLAWIENTGEQNFSNTPHPIFSPIPFAKLDAVDIDTDGDFDLVALGSLRDEVLLFEQQDQGAFSMPQLLWTLEGGSRTDIWLADLNGDLRLDLVAADVGELIWRPSRRLGDVDGNGLFDASDLVLVFQRGEFEDAIAGNSRFDTGDWNGDGDFSSADLVLAFQSGGFVPSQALFRWPTS